MNKEATEFISRPLRYRPDKKKISEDERKGRNCLGRRSKLALDPVKVGLIKKLVFRYFVVKEENKESTWKECIIRIDEMLQRKIRVAVTPPDTEYRIINCDIYVCAYNILHCSI